MELNDSPLSRGSRSRSSRFRQADISRAVKGAKAGGILVSKIEIDADGRIVITSGVAQGYPPRDEYMAWKQGRGANSA